MQNAVNEKCRLSLDVSPAPKKRILGLDGLRALAVLGVVWHHSHPGYAQYPISHNGFLGVDVFFVLSGFLITTLLLHEKHDTGNISLKGFYIRRSLRIFPLYYAVLIVLALFFTASSNSTNADVFFRELPWHATYLSNFVSLKSIMAITWSLSTEEQFYLIWPPLFVWLGVRSVWLLVVFFAINQGINFGLFDGWLNANGFPVESFPLLQITFSPILLGVILAFGMKTKFAASAMNKMPTWLPVAMVAATLLVANIGGDIRGWPRLVFHLSVAAVVASVILAPGSVIVKILEFRPLKHLGLISYGIYLFHMMVLYAVHRMIDDRLPNSPTSIFIISIIICAGLSTLSYKFFELPVMNLWRLVPPAFIAGKKY